VIELGRLPRSLTVAELPPRQLNPFKNATG
jgi:hypothetical protein